jgi:hypothetical protein
MLVIIGKILYMGHLNYILAILASNGQCLVEQSWEETQLVMEKISLAKAKDIAKKKGLKPGRVKGTEGIQFTKGKNDRLEIVSWNEFENTLRDRKLAVYESGGWMKIMKK